jgi:hypothetical protein
MILHVFCTPGGHSAQTVMDHADPLRCPEGWSRVEADCIPSPQGPDDPWAPGIWFAKDGTGCWVLCCPAHPLIQP